MSAEQESDEEYIPPTEEELTFRYGEKDLLQKLEDLIERQKKGMELGKTPRNPRGLTRHRKAHWRNEVWKPWLKKHGVNKNDLRSLNINLEGQFHSNPNRRKARKD